MEILRIIILGLWTTFALTLGFAIGAAKESEKIDLPEGYEEITPETKIKGKYVKGKDLLIIEFDTLKFSQPCS